MKHMTPSKIAQTHRIATMVMKLKDGAILRGALPQLPQQPQAVAA